MDMNGSDNQNNEINVETIMERIRASIRQKQALGELSSDETVVYQEPDHSGTSVPVSLDNEFYFISNNWAIHNNSYFISSHHPYIGRFLVKGRQLVHGEVKRYVDPVFSRQTDFNANNVKILKTMAAMIHSLENGIIRQNDALLELEDDLEGRITRSGSDLLARVQEQEEKLGYVSLELRDEYRAGLGSLAGKQEQQIGELREELRGEYRADLDSLASKQEQQLGQIRKETDGKIDGKIIASVDERVRAVVSELNREIENKAWLAGVLENRIRTEIKTPGPAKTGDLSDRQGPGINYFIFEEQFRGSRDSIKQKQALFLPYFEKCSNVLDIGCGRGEFLEMLRENGIGGRGVDSDPDMVGYCRSRSLDVVEAEAVAYLESIEDKSLDGIFIGQLVEHLEPEYLAKMLCSCFRTLKYGCHIVIETVNPLSFLSFVNFYLDLTHKRPLHPETLKFLLQSVGFREIDLRFSSFIPVEAKLKKIEILPGFPEDKRQRIDSYNYNIDMLNQVLWGPMDYAMIGKK